jgi:hypothetical protein
MPDNVVLLLTPKWSESPMDDKRREPLCFASKTLDGKWSVLLTLPSDQPYPHMVSFPAVNGPMDGKRVGDSYVMKHWGLIKIGPRTWQVNPSIQQPGLVHAYLVLCDVPEPAPWEKVEYTRPRMPGETWPDYNESEKL